MSAERWEVEFSENGGYDCMTDAWRIKPEGSLASLFSVDIGSFGQRSCGEATAEQLAKSKRVADLAGAAPELLSALKALTDATEKADNPSDMGIGTTAPEYEAARRAIDKAEGRA